MHAEEQQKPGWFSEHKKELEVRFGLTWLPTSYVRHSDPPFEI